MADLKKKGMDENTNKVVNFLDAMYASDVFKAAVPEKSSLREDLNRVHCMAKAVVSTCRLDDSGAKDLDAARAALAKNRQGSFHSAMTIYPLGSYIIDHVGKITNQHYKDQLVMKDLDVALEFAKSFQVDSFIKDNGEIAVTSQAKVIDMTAKYMSYHSDASHHVKSSTECAAKENEILMKINQVTDALMAAAGKSFESNLKDMVDLLKKLPDGNLTDEATAQLAKALTSASSFHPCPKVPLQKVIGKDRAETMERGIANVTKFCSKIEAAIPKIIAMSKEVPDETFLTHEPLKEVFSLLNDVDGRLSACKVAPVLAVALDAVEQAVSSGVTKWISKMASTFPKFLIEILKPEIGLELILTPEVVGSVENEIEEGADSKDAKGEVDWCAAYCAFVRHCRNAQAQVPFQDQTLKYHVAFICASGALLQVAKYLMVMVQKVEEVRAVKPFNDLMIGEWKGDGSKDVVFKMPALASLQHSLPKLYKALPSLNELVSSIEQVNANAVAEVKAVWQKMNFKIGQILKDAFHQGNGEINLMQTLLQELFDKIKANHSLPIIFQAEKVDRGAITSLCSDPDVNQFVAALNKVPCTSN